MNNQGAPQVYSSHHQTHLSEESLAGAAGVEEPLPDQSDELLLLQSPALLLVRSFTVAAVQPVRLPVICTFRE